MVFKSLRLS